MPDDGRHYEIIDGVLVVTGTPDQLHQRAVGRIYRVLDDACPPEFEVLLGPFAVGLADDSEIRPDLMVAKRSHIKRQELPGPPELTVEVLSPSTRLIDINVKRPRLERAGAPSFWAVDPAEDPQHARLIVWELQLDGRYQEVANVSGESEFHAMSPYPVKAVPAALVS
ncbi:MAG: Uma2 family endonuclease [Micromonosporaceae bacterium]|nr:Uma2 family endonuclease [Micromonosporaceae bacterium]